MMNQQIITDKKDIYVFPKNLSSVILLCWTLHVSIIVLVGCVEITWQTMYFINLCKSPRQKPEKIYILKMFVILPFLEENHV